MRGEMDGYALNMLQDLERRLTSHLTSLERGIEALERDVSEYVVGPKQGATQQLKQQ